LAFVLFVNGRMPFPFAMPARTEPIFKIINGRRQSAFEQTKFAGRDREQAARVAWRQLLRWIQAQFAMIDAGMVASHEVFLPYLQNDDGKTVFQIFEATRFKELPPPQKEGAA
jgi:hypothetical protein